MGKGIEFGVISDFRLAVAELYCVVGYCVGSSGQLLPTVRDKLSVRFLEVKNLKDSLYQAKPSQAKPKC